MDHNPVERPSETLRPGDHIGRDSVTYEIVRIAVSIDTVDAEAQPLAGARRIVEHLHFLPGELVRMGSAP